MTEQEWDVGVAPLLSTFAGSAWSEANSQAYRAVLGHRPLRDVLNAVQRLARKQSWRPTIHDILGELGEADAGARMSSPDEAWPAIRAAVRKVGSMYAADFPERHQAAIDWLRGEAGDVVAAFAARRGLVGPGSLGAEPVEDPERGGIALATIKRDFREAVQVAEDRMARGLPPVDPRQLVVHSRAAVGGGGMAEILERLRPVPELESGDAD